MRFNAVEPGFNPASELGRDSKVFLRLTARYLLAQVPA
jgi:hypothetical protein